MNMKRIFVLIVVSLLLWQCNSQEKQDLPNEGEITIAADESVNPIVVDELIAYNDHYPKAKIKLFYFLYKMLKVERKYLKKKSLT